MKMSKSEIAYIYTLVDPRNDLVRYVGKAQDPQKRLVGHLKGGRYPVNRWCTKLQREGLRPRLVILERCTTFRWQDAERFWIDIHRRAGFPLLNVTDGGEGGGNKLSEKAKEDIRQSRLGKKQSPETIARRGLPGNRYAAGVGGMKGKKHTAEAKRKTALKKLGNRHGEGNRGKLRGPQSPELIEKRRVANLGKKRRPYLTRKRLYRLAAIIDGE